MIGHVNLPSLWVARKLKEEIGGYETYKNLKSFRVRRRCPFDDLKTHLARADVLAHALEGLNKPHARSPSTWQLSF